MTRSPIPSWSSKSRRTAWSGDAALDGTRLTVADCSHRGDDQRLLAAEGPEHRLDACAGRDGDVLQGEAGRPGIEQVRGASRIRCPVASAYRPLVAIEYGREFM